MRRGECIGALERLRTINLDIVLDDIHDYPTLEMSGDLDVFAELIELYFKDHPEDSEGCVDSVDIEPGGEYDELLI